MTIGFKYNRFTVLLSGLRIQKPNIDRGLNFFFMRVEEKYKWINAVNMDLKHRGQTQHFGAKTGTICIG